MVTNLLAPPPDTDDEQDTAGDNFDSNSEEKGSEKSLDTNQLSKLEKSADDSNSSNVDTGEADRLGAGYSGSGGKQPWYNSKRWKYIAGGSLGGFIVIGLALFVMLGLGDQKIIHVAENITTWNAARTARLYRRSVVQSTEEVAAIGEMSATEGRFAALRTRFGESRVGQTLERFNSYRPNRVFENFASDVKPVFSEGPERILGLGNRQILEGYEMPDGTFVTKQNRRFFHPIENYREKLRFSAEIEVAMEKGSYGPNSLVRNSAMKRYLNSQGIKLYRWEKWGKKYKAYKDNARAQRQAAIENNERVNADPDPAQCVVQQVCDGTENAQNAADDEVDNVARDIDEPNNTAGASSVDDSISDAAAREVANSVSSTAWRNFLEIASTTYAIAVPLCLIYDGSIVNAESIIDANETANQREYANIQSAADQQKKGHVVGRAIAGEAGRLGRDVALSPPMLRAAGRPIDTAQEINTISLPQSSSTGDFTLFDAYLKGLMTQGQVDFANEVVKRLCPALTNPWVGAGAAAVELLAALFSGTGSRAASEGVEQGLRIGLTQIIDRSARQGFIFAFRNLGTKASTKFIGRAGGNFIVKTGVMVGATIGFTELAKMSVMKRSNIHNRGTASEDSAIIHGDMGANQLYNNINRMTMYGRPMSTTEVVDSKAKDIAYINQQEQQKSFSERYFALSNANSLVSRSGYFAMSNLGGPQAAGGKVFGFIGNLGSMYKMFGSLFTGKKAFAQSTISGAGEYNIVQSGYSGEEEDLIDNNEDYAPIMNDLILEESGKKQEIEDKYKKCFEKSMGYLLSKGDIVRNKAGEVIEDEGDCSPKNLGKNNPEYGDKVFRYRLSKRNEKVLANLKEIQDPSEDESGGDTPPSMPTDVVGEDQLEAIEGIVPGCHKSIAGNVRDMLAKARADGIVLTGSCWRDNARQIQLRIDHGCGGALIYSNDCTGSPPTAVPGTSMHERGLAIDFRCNGSTTTIPNRSSPCFIWLDNNARNYGLFNLPSEPWHWSTNGH